MGWRLPTLWSFAFLVLPCEGVLSQDHLTKKGGPGRPLKVVQLQGGFAGFTGVQFTVAPDGTWTSESIFNQKRTSRGKGKLTGKELAQLAALLKKYDLVNLPAKSGMEPGANPHTLTFEYGKMKASLVGREPPRVDPNDPAGTVESRFAGIWEGINRLLSPPPKGKEGEEPNPSP